MKITLTAELTAQIVKSSLNEAENDTVNLSVIEVAHRDHLVHALTEFSSVDEEDIVVISPDANESPALFSPLEEFIAFQLKDQLANSRELFERLNIYQFHREMIDSWLSGEDIIRSMPLVPAEYEYEQAKIYEGIYSLFAEAVGEKPQVVVIDAIEQLSTASLQWLSWVSSQKKLYGHFYLILTTSPQADKHAANVQEWSAFYAKLAQSTGLFCIPSARVIASAPSDIIRIPSGLDKAKQCGNALSLLQLSDCISLGKSAYVERYSFLSEHSREFNQLLLDLSLAYTLNHQWDDAVYYLNQLEHHAEKEGDQRFTSRAKAAFAQVSLLRGKLEEAAIYLEQALDIADSVQDDRLIEDVLCGYVDFIAWGGEVTEALYLRLKQSLDTVRLKNHFAYFCQCVHLSGKRHESIEQLKQLCQDAVAMHLTSGNQYGLAQAQHMLGVVFGYLFDTQNSISNLRESIKLSEILQLDDQIIQLSNGLGYAESISEQFESSLLSYQRALSLITKKPKGELVSSTVFNIAMLYFVTRNFEPSLRIFLKLNSILSLLNIPQVPFHSNAKIQSLIGICYIKTGNNLKAIKQMAKVDSLPQPPNRAGESFYYISLLRALTAAETSGSIDRAKQLLESAPSSLDTAFISNRRLMPQFHAETVLLYLQNNQAHDVISSAVQKGVNVSEELSYPLHAKWIADIATVKTDMPIVPLESIDSHVDQVIEVIKREAAIKELKAEVANYEYASLVEIAFVRAEEREQVIDEFINIIKKRFDAPIIDIVVDDKHGCLHRRELESRDWLLSETIDDAIHQSQVQNMPTFTRYDKSMNDATLETSINIPAMKQGKHGINFFVATTPGKQPLQEPDIQVLVLLLGQLSNAIQHASAQKTIIDQTLQIKQLQKEASEHNVAMNELNSEVEQLKSSEDYESLIASMADIISRSVDEGSRPLSTAGKEVFSRRAKMIGLYGKMVTGKIEKNLQLECINKVTLAALKAVQKKYQADIEYTLNFADSDVAAFDPILAVKAIGFLLSNAYESLTEYQCGTDKLQFLIETQVNDKRISVTITNDCVIPLDNIDQLKKPFFTTKSTDTHLGLGLTLASRIADLHGGELRCAVTKDHISVTWSVPKSLKLAN